MFEEKRRRRLMLALMEVRETVGFLSSWGAVPEARSAEWFQGNVETLVVQLKELLQACHAFRG